jgi:hypothetical protein
VIESNLRHFHEIRNIYREIIKNVLRLSNILPFFWKTTLHKEKLSFAKPRKNKLLYFMEEVAEIIA